MSFFSKLTTPSNIFLKDEDFGELTNLKIEEENVLWMGNLVILECEAEIFIRGTKTQVDPSEKEMILQVLNNVSLETISENTLREMYKNAGNEFVNWRVHFDCVSITSYNNQAELTFTEKETDADYIIHFVNGHVESTSIED